MISILHEYIHVKENNKYIKKDPEIVCEIGGGYGCMGELIINSFESKFISIDLPEANMLTTYYLSNIFGDKKFFLYTDYINNGEIIDKETIDNYDIFILPPFVKLSDEVGFDLVINKSSFMEMRKSTIKYYFNFIQKYIHIGGIFLNANRYLKTKVGQSIFFHEYPYDNNWEVLISKASLLQKQIHVMITQRLNQKNATSNLKKELNKIKSNPQSAPDKNTKKFFRKLKKMISIIKKIIKFPISR